jgi:hypothetical protein
MGNDQLPALLSLPLCVRPLNHGDTEMHKGFMEKLMIRKKIFTLIKACIDQYFII